LLIACICSVNVLLAQTANRQTTADKISVTRQVFDNLVNAYGSSKGPPVLKMLPGRTSGVVARYTTYPVALIEIDEQLYDICTTFGKRSSDALAIIISHELAHYYNDHNWCSDYAFSFRHSDLGRKLSQVSKETRIEKESMADGYGLFYACMAGYHPFDIFDTLLDKIYGQYHLPETMPGYPSRNERKEINKVQRGKIKSLALVFDAGILLLHLKQYAAAAACFSYLNQFFPGREMYNNLGVSRLLEALNYKEPDTLNFIYPIEIDAASRIYQGGERGIDTVNRQRKCRELLEEAKTAFGKAIFLDPGYSPSHVNLACLYDIEGNYPAAEGEVAEVAKWASKDSGRLQLIGAIAEYHAGKGKEALEILRRLSRTGPLIYRYNYQLVEHTFSEGLGVKEMEHWRDEWVKQHLAEEDTGRDSCPALSDDAIPGDALYVNEYTSIRSYYTPSGLLLSVNAPQMKLVAAISISGSTPGSKQPYLPDFRIRNKGCTTIEMPQAVWRVAYKITGK